MRHRSLSLSLVLATAAVLWSMVTLGCRADVIGPATRDTIVVIDTGYPTAMVTGNVAVYRLCDMQDRKAVRVDVPELGYSTVTDSLGSFTIPSHPLRQLTYIYSRQDVYTRTVRSTPSSNPDGTFRLPWVQLFRPHSYTAELIGDVVYTRFKTPVVKDSTYLGADGEWYTTRVYADSIDYGFVDFTARCFDEADKLDASAVPMLFISRQKNIDASDSSTYLFYVNGKRLERRDAARHGIKPYESIYVAASSHPSCTFAGPYPGLRCSPSWGIQAP